MLLDLLYVYIMKTKRGCTTVLRILPQLASNRALWPRVSLQIGQQKCVPMLAPLLLLLLAYPHLLGGMLTHIKLIFDLVRQIGRIIRAWPSHTATYSPILNHITGNPTIFLTAV